MTSSQASDGFYGGAPSGERPPKLDKGESGSRVSFASSVRSSWNRLTQLSTPSDMVPEPSRGEHSGRISAPPQVFQQGIAGVQYRWSSETCGQRDPDSTLDCATGSRSDGFASRSHGLRSENSQSSLSSTRTFQGQKELRDHWQTVFSHFVNKRQGAEHKDEASRGGVIEDAMDVLDEWGREFKHGGDPSIEFVFYALTSLFSAGDANVSSRRDNGVEAGLIEQLIATGEECEWKPFYLHCMLANITALCSDTGDGSAAARQDAAIAASSGCLMDIIKTAIEQHPRHIGVQDSARILSNLLEPAIQRAAAAEAEKQSRSSAI